MQPMVIVISGGIASGKSTLAHNLSSLLRWPTMSFGAYVRTLAERNGIALERTNLQDLGESLVIADSTKFCKESLSFGGWKPMQPIIIDGVRHMEVLHAIRFLVSPLRVFWIMLDAPQELRRERLLRRGDQEALELKIHLHPTEREVENFRPYVNILIDGTQDESIILECSLKGIQNFRTT